MDDTQASDAAAATRKRRSSILKNQRPPRTPFSEVEFNVATPSDTTKSRRVSFSRRTGVAEFITNEATTTWKNFYEKHNKSLESSGNDSAANAPKQTVEHIGKRIFDQQFEEVEIDFGGTLHANPLQEFQASFNNINLTQQLASLECMTNDIKFAAPQSKFEQSAVTELSKPFGSEINVPILEDMTNPISMNFSSMHSLGANDKCDDLDEIQKDLGQSNPNVMCPGPMSAGKDFSGFIEVMDLNLTYGAIHKDESEMSITDIITTPEVQEVSKSNISLQKVKIVDNDWTKDKENIVINPYVAPKESQNFAINKASDEVLVFDGKRLITQSISVKTPEVEKENIPQTLLLKPVVAPRRKTIILNVNDDLPNFIERNSSVSNMKPLDDNHSTNMVMLEDVNLSITSAIDNEIRSNIVTLNNVDKHENQNTIYETDACNISFTQAVPSSIISTAKRTDEQAKDNTFNKTRNNTIHFDNMIEDISMTQAIPNNIIHLSEGKDLKPYSKNEKRKTIIFDGDSCNISMTQVLPTNINVNDNGNGESNMNAPTKELISTDKRKTLIFNEDSCNISITQALPTNINYIKNTICESSSDKQNEILTVEERKTIIFDNDSYNISMTQVLPTNIKLHKEEIENDIDKKVLSNENSREVIPTQKRKTIIFDDDSCNISMTQVLPTNIKFLNNEINKNVINEHPKQIKTEKRKTIIFNDDACDISMTEVIPTNINFNTLGNPNVKSQINEKENMEKRNTIVFDNKSCDVSVTQAIPLNIYTNEKFPLNNIPANQSTNCKHAFELEKTHNLTDLDITKGITENVILPTTNPEKRRTVIFDNNLGDVSITQTVPPNILTKIIENNNLDSNDLDVYSSNNKDNLDSDKHKSKINDLKNDLNDLKQQILNQVQIDKSKIGNENLPFGDDVDLATASVKLIKFTNKEEIQCLRDEVRNSLEPIFNEHVINETNVIDDNINITKTVAHIQNKIEILQDAVLEKNNVTTENAIQKDMSNFVIPENIFKFEENEKSFHKTSIPQLRKSVLIYQVDTNEQSRETRMDESIHDKSAKKNKSLNRDITAAQSICNESPIKFSNNDDNEHKKPANHNGDELENSYIEKQMSISQQRFSENICRSDSDIRSKPKKSILNELLDMSCESLEKNLSVNRDIHVHNLEIQDQVNEKPESIQIEQSSEPNSRESYLKINSDSETMCVGTNSNKISDVLLAVPIKSRVSAICLENKSNENNLVQKSTEFNEDIDMKDSGLPQKNTEPHQEHINNLNDSENQEGEITEHFDQSNGGSIRNADNTKDLLKMLSDFTDEGEEPIIEEKDTQMTDFNPEKTNPSTRAEDMEIAIDYKNIKQEPRRLSFATKRPSIVISREDLLHNISMAKAVLQQSRFEVEESDMIDDSSDSMDILEENELRNSIRMSSEVVKTLQFEDESASDASIKAELKMSPLKKTAFGETAYMNEDKAKVIPTYLKDVSDDIKGLMNDLVKPNSDIPFENVKNNLTSTCSTEIQANLMTSSQIDIDVELVSNYESDYKITENKSTVVDVKPTSTIEFEKNVKAEKSIAEETHDNNILQEASSQKITTDEVIVFDHNNPLRNVLLPSIDCTDVHKYNPISKDDTENAVQDSHDCTNEKIEQKNLRQSIQYHMQVDQNTHSVDVELKKSRKSVQHNLDKKIPTEIKMQSGDAACENVPSITSCVSKPLSMDRSVEGIVTTVKDTEVNTLIAMTENKELLDQSSSLTLVDDGPTDSECVINVPQPYEENTKCQKLPVRIIYKIENEPKFVDKDSDVTSNEEFSDSNDVGPKTRKRSYSPTKKDSFISNIEVTPKPISKMQKMSNSPQSKSIIKSYCDTNNRDASEAKSTEKVLSINSSHTEINNMTNQQHDKSSSKSSKLTQTIKLDAKISTNVEDKKSVKPGFSSDSEMQDPTVTVSQVLSSVASKISGFAEERISNNQIKTESSSNVIDEINMLSFMGSSECEWDWSGGADTWAFRLLRGRLRLRTRLAHRHYDAVRSCVRADTPLLDVDVDVIQCEDKDSLIALCVDLAAEAMRYERSRLAGALGSTEGVVGGTDSTVRGARAADVPALLRRCVAVARLARRWARVMRDARARLAYDIAPGGLIVLKVANIPLRCVWEVRMRVCVQVADARSGACPRAADVCVAPALAVRAPAPATLSKLTAAQPADWGHAPRTLWKVFRYLKNRTKDEDLLGL